MSNLGVGVRLSLKTSLNYFSAFTHINVFINICLKYTLKINQEPTDEPFRPQWFSPNEQLDAYSLASGTHLWDLKAGKSLNSAQLSFA